MGFFSACLGTRFGSKTNANMSTNYYEVLGIDQKTSTTLDIRKAYKNLALKFHPDKNNNTGAEEKFKLILEAHNVLIDPVKRAEFDQKLNTNYKWKCTMCSATFEVYFDLAEHLRKSHPKKFVCIYCYNSYAKSEELFEHVSDLHECSICFGEFADLTQHKKKCQPLQFQCSFCNASFAKYKHLFNHVSCFHSKPFECNRCKAAFAKSEELIQHVWEIHQFKIVKYVFVGVFWGFSGCVSGGIMEGVLGGVLGGALGGIFGADFFAREEDLNKHQRIHSSAPEWKPKQTKMRNKKRRK